MTEEKKLTKRVEDVLNVLSDDYKKRLGVGPEYGKLLKSEVAIFKIVAKPKVVRNTANDEIDLYPASVIVPNTDTIFDGDNTYEIESPLKTGKAPNGSDLFDMIGFYRDSSSEIVITSREPHKFPLMWYLRMSNYNRSNPFQLDGMVSLFEEVQFEVIDADNVDREVEIATLTTFIASKSYSDLTQICTQLRLVTGEAETEKKKVLIAYIKNDANRLQFKNTVISGVGVLVELIRAAKKHELVSMDDDTKMWYNVVSGKKINAIYHTPIGEDPEKAFAKFLSVDEKGKKLKLFLEAKVQELVSAKQASQLGKSL